MRQQQSNKSFNISNPTFYISLASMIAFESYSLYRFSSICKSNQVEGIEQGYFGFFRDHSDAQWGEFAGHLAELMAFQLIFLIGSYAVKYYSKLESKQRNLQYYNICLGMSYAFYLHNIGMIFQLSIIIGFYLFQKIFYKMKYFIPVLWTLALVTLWSNETFQGYSFAMISPQLKFLEDFKHNNQLVRWNLVFNMILLRIISFSVDKVWASQSDAKYKYDLIHEKQILKTYRERVQEPQPIEEYNFLGYLSFLFYVPLLFSGPSMGYNAFNSQLKIPQQQLNRAQVLKYILRVYFLDYLTFELFLHVCYPNAIPKIAGNFKILKTFSVFELHVMGFTNLIFLWYKFLTIWRIARGWALLDGIETPENMNRCIYNNYNFSGFWRSWHRSFNQWLIRYIYVPLGGSKYKSLNMWAVFTFVALWHDFKLDLLLWAWIICLALIPEIALQKYFDKEYFYKKPWFIWLCRLGGGFQIEMMCLANLIGFGNGHEGMNFVLEKYMSWEGLICFIFYCVIRNGWATTIQFRIRDDEKAEQNEKNF
ncbi:unnamed protein product (macronuclear) [Paramecium tetraurelia]|uniref:Uncharacterized protein n=1 Tax=Paramecium tetraurelia TaxID=5888 RepID=A0DKT3_PARTE|nr:uncharacterized protein GSPATT00017980001 [Paramecium tetraurelia]CAK83650.1 unnamed protein product [Paramecium tetraurelia]|eukprot:XP_001451047.1 hypothetical protein (macronuclear) [Paramecium tetraurelia strain d4-2]